MPETKSPIHPVYLEAVEYLTKHPEQIYPAWLDPHTHPGGALFYCASPRRKFGLHRCGCLTQIRQYDPYVAIDANQKKDVPLTRCIREDKRIPDNPYTIQVADLMVFAEWQQYLDEYYGREAPAPLMGEHVDV